MTAEDIRALLDRILQLQQTYPHGPAWYEAYSALYDQWVTSPGNGSPTSNSD